MARAGDHLLVPFQCDLCSFRNLTLRNPSDASPQDTFLLCCIRRANLDAVCGREPNTVNGTLRGVRQLVNLWRLAHIPIKLPTRGPFPVGDGLGLRVAIGMLIKSLEPGRYSQAYQQLETIHKLRAAFSNLHICLPWKGSTVSGRLVVRQLKCHSPVYPPTRYGSSVLPKGVSSVWGQEVRQDWALPLPVLRVLLELLEDEWYQAEGWTDKHRVAVTGCFSVVAFCGSFRGNKVFLMDLYGLSKYLAELVGEPFIIVPLLGKYKGEAHHRYHLMPLVARTDSGLPVRTWIGRLVQVQHEIGRIHGPAFGDRYGEILESSFVEGLIADRL